MEISLSLVTNLNQNETPKSSDKPKEGKRSLPSTGTADHLGLLVTGLTFVATAIASMKLKKKEDF